MAKLFPKTYGEFSSHLQKYSTPLQPGLSPATLRYVPNDVYDDRDPGFLSGEVKIKGKLKSGFILKLFSEKYHLPIEETISLHDGTFKFDSPLNKKHSFYIIARDPEGKWEDRVSSRRKPA